MWGLGCAVCAAFDYRRFAEGQPSQPSRSRASTLASRRGRHKRLGTKWARYEVSAQHLQASHIQQHSLTDAHKLAMAAHIAPDRPVRIALQLTVEDDQLLAGAVPQPADWLRAWRLCMDPSSWEAAEHQAQTEHFIAQIRPRPVQSRSFKAMVCCMAAALRARKRQWLGDATCVFFGFDDKNGRKLLRFKVDTPAAAPCFDAVAPGDPTLLPYGARIGVIGCMPTGLSSTLEDFERDYAEKTAEEVLKLISAACTPEGDVLDEVLFDSVLAKTRGLVVDGALLKTAHQLKATRMRNVSIIMRDPAHIIRTTCRDPLHDGAVFREQYARLFGDRHAVLKDFQHSTMWRDQLEACQRKITEEGGSLGGDLKTSLRHLAFVQPRFESFVSPRRRYACLLRAIAQVLVTKAGDPRLSSEVRKRADAALNAMSGRDCFAAGLAGDYGEVCLEFLRYFDVSDHDPARTATEVEGFVKALRCLFVEGYVLCSSGETEIPGLGARKTLAQIALENIEEPLVLRYRR